MPDVPKCGVWLGMAARAAIYLELLFVSTEGERSGEGLAMGDEQHVSKVRRGMPALGPSTFLC